MREMSPVVAVSLVKRMLREAFEGPPGPWTYFTDLAPGTGVFGTISGLSAGQASQGGDPATQPSRAMFTT